MDTVGGTILVAVILIAIVAAIIYKLVKDKKQGKSSCGGSCGCCQILLAVTDHDKTVINSGRSSEC